MGKAKSSALAGFAVLSIALGGCASTIDRIPYTQAEAEAADIPGMGNVRFYADSPSYVFDRFRRPVFAAAAARHEPVTYLALSSGGSDGAFGAGFLKGLSESHQRLDYTIVSGISTGALMAPFAFLGSRYDGTLEDLYTSGYASDLVSNVSVINGLLGNALVDSDKLGHFIARYIDQHVLDDVAAEGRKGRRLLVVTTNLDQQRSVVWDMTAIAATPSAEALPLFRQVLAASASIPGLFPPRLIDVEAGGRSFKEMHVDGATIRQVYVAPDEIIFGNGNRANGDAVKDLYILVNNKIDPSFDVVADSTVSVAARGLSTILKREGRNNVLSGYSYARDHNVGYHIAFIDADVPEPPGGATQQFSTAYMRGLFARGEADGRRPSPWSSHPPLAPDPAGRDLTAAK